MEMCSKTFVVVWTKSIHGFTLITLLFPETCLWNSVEMCRMNLVVVWSNSINGFTLMTLLFRTKSSWLSLDMCRMTLAVLWIKIYPWVPSNTSFTSRIMSLKLSEDV